MYVNSYENLLKIHQNLLKICSKSIGYIRVFKKCIYFPKYRHCGQKESVIFCDQIMSLGFREAFKAGISFGKDDMVIPLSKSGLVNSTRTQVNEFEKQYMDGLINGSSIINTYVLIV